MSQTPKMTLVQSSRNLFVAHERVQLQACVEQKLQLLAQLGDRNS